jgi:hypothetical protein
MHKNMQGPGFEPRPPQKKKSRFLYMHKNIKKFKGMDGFPITKPRYGWISNHKTNAQMEEIFLVTFRTCKV